MKSHCNKRNSSKANNHYLFWNQSLTLFSLGPLTSSKLGFPFDSRMQKA